MNLALDNVPMPLFIIPAEPLDDGALLELCESNDFFRIERTKRGELRVMSSTGGGTGNSSAHLTVKLGTWAIEDGRGAFFDSSSGFTPPDRSMLSPDAAWVETSRWVALTDAERRRFPPICPDFVVELRSESDPLAALQEKMELWMANGAQPAWLIDLLNARSRFTGRARQLKRCFLPAPRGEADRLPALSW